MISNTRLAHSLVVANPPSEVALHGFRLSISENRNLILMMHAKHVSCTLGLLFLRIISVIQGT